MHYFGGKYRIAKDLAAFINKYTEDKCYYEPFVGGANVTQYIKASKLYASDKHPQLIALWQELQNGWIPPENVTEREYQELKFTLSPPHLAGFVGFGCSYSGKWFGGYCRDNTGRNYAKNAKNSLLKKVALLQDVEFSCRDYKELTIENDSVIYCDPPYTNTTGYSVGLDSEEFWQWVRERSESSIVFVSEYTAPEDFSAVWQKQTKLDIRSKGGVKSERCEKLFVFNKYIENIHD